MTTHRRISAALVAALALSGWACSSPDGADATVPASTAGLQVGLAETIPGVEVDATVPASTAGFEASSDDDSDAAAAAEPQTADAMEPSCSEAEHEAALAHASAIVSADRVADLPDTASDAEHAEAASVALRDAEQAERWMRTANGVCDQQQYTLEDLNDVAELIELLELSILLYGE